MVTLDGGIWALDPLDDWTIQPSCDDTDTPGDEVDGKGETVALTLLAPLVRGE
jgi:hypothetical protein